MKGLVRTLITWGPAGLFTCSLLDGAGLPMPGGVDVLLTYLASQSPSSMVLLAILATFGSTIGNLILFTIARKGGEAYLNRHTPSRMGMHFRRWFQHYGLLTVFTSALVPLPFMPMKIFVLCSGALGVNPLHFLVVFLVARIPRYFGLAYLGSQMGSNAMGYVKGHMAILSLVALVLFLLLFSAVKLVDRLRASSK